VTGDQISLSPEAAESWDALMSRPARELPGLRDLMDRPSPFGAEAMGSFLHHILNPESPPGPPYVHVFSPGIDEELASDTVAVLEMFAEMVRSTDRYGHLKEELGDDRVLECLEYAARLVRNAAVPPAHTVTS